ncbi:MAG TPA: hypothetical protein ENK98_09140 [Epsilonproteobacteria bacterium]|nr:hypothetical protein [Campylobacterota bacterium]
MTKILLILTLGVYVHATSIALPENFQADFTQKITNPKKKVIHYSGNVRFSNKSLLKWAYTKPTKKEVCTNGVELTVVDHDLEQVSNYLISKGFNFTKILKKAKPHSKNIYVAKYENKNYTIQVDKKQRLQSIAYYDDLDNKVQIVFKKVKYGKGNLSKKVMTCKVPKDYDMIRG